MNTRVLGRPVATFPDRPAVRVGAVRGAVPGRLRQGAGGNRADALRLHLVHAEQQRALRLGLQPSAGRRTWWRGRRWWRRGRRDAGGGDAGGGDAGGATQVVGTRAARRRWWGHGRRDAGGGDTGGATQVVGTRAARRRWWGHGRRDAGGGDAGGATQVVATRAAAGVIDVDDRCNRIGSQDRPRTAGGPWAPRRAMRERQLGRRDPACVHRRCGPGPRCPARMRAPFGTPDFGDAYVDKSPGRRASLGR